MSLIYKIEKHPTDVHTFFFEGKILTPDFFDETIKSIQTRLEQNELKFVFNLKALEHINSNGLNLFLKLFSKIRSKGGDLVFSEVSEGVSKLLHISKLDSIFNICASDKEAINYLNANIE